MTALMLVSYAVVTFISASHALSHVDPIDGSGSHATAAEGDGRYDANETRPAAGCVICAHGIVAHLVVDISSSDLPLEHSPLLAESPSPAPAPAAEGIRSTRAPPTHR